jgi:hypothetical protein
MSGVDTKAIYDSYVEQCPALLQRAHMMLLAGHTPEWIVAKLRSQMIEEGRSYTESGLLEFRLAVEYLANHQGEIGVEQLLQNISAARN